MGYNRLLETKEILNNFRDNQIEAFSDYARELKPSYGNRFDSGYNYAPISRPDDEFIYGAMSTLSNELKSKIFEFNIERDYITPKKAIEELQAHRKLLYDDLEKLNKLKAKYTNEIGDTPYPLYVTIICCKKVFDLFEHILESEEIKEAAAPGYVTNLENRLSEYEFENHWRALNKKYRIRVYSYLTFLALSIIAGVYASDYTLFSILALFLSFIHALINKNKTWDSLRSFVDKNLKEEKRKEWLENRQN